MIEPDLSGEAPPDGDGKNFYLLYASLSAVS